MTDGKKWFEKITCTGIFVFTDVSRMLEKKEKKRKKKIRKIIEYILIIKCIFVMHSGICFKNAYVYRLVVQVVDIYFININKSHAS